MSTFVKIFNSWEVLLTKRKYKCTPEGCKSQISNTFADLELCFPSCTYLGIMGSANYVKLFLDHAESLYNVCYRRLFSFSFLKWPKNKNIYNVAIIGCSADWGVVEERSTQWIFG